MIDYDASRDALYRPQLRPTLIAAGARLDPDALCAECSRLAYLHFDNDAVQHQALVDALARAGFLPCAGFSGAATGTQAYAARHATRAEAIVVFRGTQPGDFADLATNINVRPQPWPKGGRVHGGFAAAFDSVRGTIERWLAALPADAAVTLTGHSLGAALATLGMSRWNSQRLVTFGAPRVGNDAFVATLDAGASVRYVDCCDIVCAVPPASTWYADSGPMRYIDRAGIVRTEIAAADIAADRSAARREYFVRYARTAGNVLLRDLADHAPINYLRALI